MRSFLSFIAILSVLSAFGVERVFDFDDSLNHTPPGFRSTVAGTGKPGDWKVILDDVPISWDATGGPTTNRTVLAQLTREPIDAHFPMLLYDQATFGDFRLTTRFKIAGGAMVQMAGVVFRFQDEKNYYVLMASSLDQRFWFFKVTDGKRGPLIGPTAAIQKNVWHTLTVDCKGDQIQCLLNGKEVIPTITDNSFRNGKIGFWTKSDSVSYFADTKITYIPHEILAAKLVRDSLKEFPRVTDLKIYAAPKPGGTLSVVASKDEKDIGQPGGKNEQDVVRQGTSYYSKGRETVSLTLPLRDRNGDPIAAVLVTLKSFPGQTEENALVRAQPIVKQMQASVQSLDSLLE